jgi:AbrB family looped-hinge helix DNA binding protein
LEEPEVAVVGTKGQIVIPREMRTKLNIRPKTKLAVYRSGDKLVLAKLTIPSLGEELKELFREIDSRYKKSCRPSEKAILEEIQTYRTERRQIKGRPKW